MDNIITASFACNAEQSSMLFNWSNYSGNNVHVFQGINEFTESYANHNYPLIFFGWNCTESDSSAELLVSLKAILAHNVHIIVLSDSDSEEEIAKALYAGADRYLQSDVSNAVLSAMIAALRRRTMPASKIMHYPPYQMNQMTREVVVGDLRIQLTPGEFRIAQYLFENNEQILTRASLLRDIWGLPDLHYNRRVDTKISHVRRKMFLDGTYGWQLKFPRGKGYRLSRPDSEQHVTE